MTPWPPSEGYEFHEQVTLSDAKDHHLIARGDTHGALESRLDDSWWEARANPNLDRGLTDGE